MSGGVQNGFFELCNALWGIPGFGALWGVGAIAQFRSRTTSFCTLVACVLITISLDVVGVVATSFRRLRAQGSWPGELGVVVSLLCSEARELEQQFLVVLWPAFMICVLVSRCKTYPGKCYTPRPHPVLVRRHVSGREWRVC